MVGMGLGCALALALPGAKALAATILAVDFNSSTSTANTETPDFVAFNGSTNGGTSAGQLVSGTYTVSSPSVASNSVTVRVAGASNVDANGVLIGLSTQTLSFNVRSTSQLADSGAFTYADLYRDFVYNSTTGAVNTYVQFDGLDPNTQYGFTFYAYDRGSGAQAAKTSTFTDLTNNAQLGSPIAYGTTVVATSNDQFSTSGTGITDANGRILFRDTSSVFAATINGFQISEVPEPGAIGLMAFASSWFLYRRRQSR